MYSLFENLLAARGSDENVWIQIIIIAVIIGVSIIKAIIRGAKNMMEQNEDNTTSISDKPKRRYADDDGSFKTIEQLREEKKTQIRATYGIPEPPIQKEPQTVNVEEPLQLAAPEPQYIPQPLPIERPVYRPEPIRPVMHTATAAAPAKTFTKKSKAHIPAPKPARESVRKWLFSSPDDLRNAILYQEILGKPLALRNE